jgi:hypothetical protein
VHLGRLVVAEIKLDNVCIEKQLSVNACEGRSRDCSRRDEISQINKSCYPCIGVGATFLCHWGDLLTIFTNSSR